MVAITYHFLDFTGLEATSFHSLYQEEESNPEAFGLVVEAEGILVVGFRHGASRNTNVSKGGSAMGAEENT